MTTTLLIKPTNSSVGYDARQLGINFEPLGLMYLSSFIKKFSAHQVKVVDAQAQSPSIHKLPGGRLRMGLSDEELAAIVRDFRPDVVGITCLFERLADDVVNAARVVKEASPQTIVVIGGMDASTRYAEYLSNEHIDLVVIGSGEEPYLDILNMVGSGKPATGIPGTCERLVGPKVIPIASSTPKLSASTRRAAFDTRTSTGIPLRVNPSHHPRVQFDEYPYPDRDCLPRSQYDNAQTQALSFPFARDRPAYLIQSSRGCGLRCSFCEIISVFDLWFAHSAEYVVGEIEECVRKYGAREFIFLDDNFMLNPKRVEAICRLIVQRGLKISLDVLPGVSVWTLSEEIIDLMIKAGVYRVCLPIESGNPETLKFIRKPIDLEVSKRMIDYSNRKGLLTYANLIIGFPYETAEDIERTLEWGRTSGLDFISYYVAQPLKGARMYEIYEQNGWLEGNANAQQEGAESQQDDYAWRPTRSWRTAHFDSRGLSVIADRAASEYLLERVKFYLRPRNIVTYLWPKINSLYKMCYVMKVTAYMLFRGRKISSNQKYWTIRALLQRRTSRSVAAG